jgi:hypothetical protein
MRQERQPTKMTALRHEPRKGNEAGRSIMAKPTTNRVIFENESELITFTLDGHLLHTHKTTFVQRHSLDNWPDFESAKKAFESGPAQIMWGDPE